MARKKKITDATALPGIDAKAEFQLGPFERAEKLEPLLGLRDSDLRNIANNLRRPNGEVWFPKPSAAHYDTVKVVRGYIDLLTNRAGRAKDMPVYSTMDAMSNATGISLTLLKEWKKSGCPAFRSRGDIVLEDLLRWIEGWLVGSAESDASELKTEGVSTWDEYRVKFQARNEKLKNQELLDLIIQKNAASETAAQLVGILETYLQKIASEYPTLIEGRDKKQIRAIVDANCREVRTSLRDALEKFSSTKRHEAQTKPSN